MLRISRSTLLASIAIMIAIVAAACDTAAEKPDAEPPTPIPTVVSESSQTSDDEVPAQSEDRIRAPGDRGGTGSANIADLEVQQCLAGELGIDLSASDLDLTVLRQLDPVATSAAFVACGVEFGRPVGAGGILGGGGFIGGGFADPEIIECLIGELGEDALDNLGQGSGLGLEPESLAAFEACGLNFGDGSSGFQFGGRDRTFGGGQRGAFGGDGSLQECLIVELGEEALSLLRNPDRTPSAELQTAFEKCNSGTTVPVETDGGIDDGAGLITIPSSEEPAATQIPVSELTIDQLTCLSGVLDSSDLASAVIATSSGDLSEIPDEILAALQTCSVGS